MKTSLADATWDDIEAVRVALMEARALSSVEAVAEVFVRRLAETFGSVVLARVFLVVPFEQLDAPARAFVHALPGMAERIHPRTPVLGLCASAGRHPDWNGRLRSQGHLAIPLLSREFVQGIPMIARLLTDLGTDLPNLDSGLSIVSRRMMGGLNGTFYVPDAPTMVDTEGRAVISALPFVTQNRIRTVFGMGGAYVDGTLAVAVVFTDERLERLVVERFPSLISNFKMASGELLADRRLFMSQ